MAEVYFERSSELEEYLMEKLGVSEDDAADCLGDLEDYEEESYKRSTRCSGYFKDNLNNVYYSLTYTSDYDWGSSDFYLDTTPLRKFPKVVTSVINEYLPVTNKGVKNG
jgi:hypothetical protein